MDGVHSENRKSVCVFNTLFSSHQVSLEKKNKNKETKMLADVKETENKKF